jgi:hypothetical protein
MELFIYLHITCLFPDIWYTHRADIYSLDFVNLYIGIRFSDNVESHFHLTRRSA